MCITELGMMTLVKEVHPAKAEKPMWVTELGIITLVKELQRANANLPMRVTDSEIVNLANMLHSLKALGTISLVPFGISTAIKEPKPLSRRSRAKAL